MHVGTVVYIYNDKITPSKNKYMACVVVDNSLFLNINSKNRTMYECLPISQKNNTYLRYDSFIACDKAFKLEDGDLKNAQIVGQLNYKDLSSLYSHLNTNVKKMRKDVKREILISLNDALDDMR